MNSKIINLGNPLSSQLIQSIDSLTNNLYKKNQQINQKLFATLAFQLINKQREQLNNQIRNPLHIEL